MEGLLGKEENCLSIILVGLTRYYLRAFVRLVKAPF